jgi:hypothetical protein
VTSFGLTIPATEDALIATDRKLSVRQKGSFLGFSIELSVAPSISESGAVYAWTWRREKRGA